MTAADPEGRVRHLLDVMHKTFDDAGDPIAAGMVPVADGLGQVDYIDSSTFGGGGLAWFNVMDAAYGAVNDGSTNDRAAINLAIAAMNSAGRGVLYFPAGLGYVVSGGALTTITANGLVLGDGMGEPIAPTYVSAILFNSQTAVCFTHTGDQLAFHDIGIFNTYSGTPSAGAGIQVSGSTIAQKVDLDSVVLSGFYVNLDRQVGSQWQTTNCWNYGPVLYGEKIQNTVNQDAGDWIISDSFYFADTDNATSLIHVIGAGGGKITGCKLNGHGSARAVVGLHIAIPTGLASGVFAMVGNSIENVSGDAILIDTTGTGNYHDVTISGLQVGLYSNNTGRAVKVNAATHGTTIGASGSILVISIDGLAAATDGTARAAISLTNTDTVTLGDFALYGFNARYTSSGDTNTIDGGSVTFATPSIALSTAAAAGAASTVIRSDSTIAAFDATVPTTIGYGDAAATGSVAFAARRDHRHGAMAAPTGIGPILISDTPSTPLVFADLIQNEAQDDLVYADP